MNSLLSVVRYCFFASYSLLVTRDQKYAHISLGIIVAIDRLFKFKFLKEYARKQHGAFSLEAEKRIVELIGNKILDIGSGMGYWGLLLKDHGRVMIALEICDSYLHLAKMVNAYDAVIKGSVNALPIRAGYFDTALAIEVIEHVSRQNGFSLISEAKRVSERVIVTAPLDISGNENLPSWVPESEHHLSSWTEQELREAGFLTTLLGRSLLAVKGGGQATPVSVR
jgi:2-polyprenyl-3-methyl-5-hydroxy-6-metoxy-1,4-benzoquinol methylase